VARRVLSSAFLPLLALGSTALLVGVLLAVTPLNETPDTYCERLTSPPVGSGCDAVTTRRLHWVIVAAVVALLAIALTVAAARSRVAAARPRRAIHLDRATPHDRATRPVNRRIAAAVLTCAAVALATVAAGFLTIGLDHDMCGSTLSRVDPDGSYAPDRPVLCAPSYADSRAAAWWAGGLAVTALVGATALDRSSLLRQDQQAPLGPDQRVPLPSDQ
jgi:hypothetical protein